MLQKWKDILTNWINCYFSDSDSREERVTAESLLNIISHLRENLNLDESKSSILEAHTIEEFVREKYPDFQFNSGSVEASNEDELCLTASLLLYFVCVNSKDVNIKHAMCSQLGSEDQEVILKFSKCLMECAPVTYKDVQAAITEACGQDLAATGPSGSRMVSETPPALRSLHGEVRRLQAALDAERFDRNYLQEELARTNLRVETLVKDKEQYKLEIVNLKSKIFLCCGQESDARGGDAGSDGVSKLTRQLEEMEERLVHTQGQLDDAQYERDAYKAKITELKQERDKWLSLSQQESARASQLCDELEAERGRAQSLRELLAELKEHQQLNRLDSSQLECDDPDASMHSLHHNLSVCSEACANVVEVQLGEERAKIVVLKQQIQHLQDQLNDLTQKTESEKQSLERVLSERENDIFNLKHRINEEIEEKNNMSIHYSIEMTKLNNDINELEQKLKDNNNQSRVIVETKMQEIQTLQEEKLSLLQSLNDETTKLENVITNLKSELDAEKASKAKMREEYDNHIMKLNEKVLNRNNELVELQNDVFEKSDRIEALHLELRKEKQAREQLLAKYNNECEQINEKLVDAENVLKLKCEEIERLTDRLNYSFDFIREMGREVDELKHAVSEQTENCTFLTNGINLMTVENKSLYSSLQETKVAHEEIEMERNSLLNSIAVLKQQNKKQISEWKDKQEELDKVKLELTVVKTQKEKNEEANAQLSAVLLNSVDKVLDKLRRDNISNEVLKELLHVDSTDILSMEEKCDLIVKMADTLTIQGLGGVDGEECLMEPLKDLVAELRCQHPSMDNQLNADGAETSMTLLPHNLSICIEACANMAAVQLYQEKSKIAVLQQQIQSLQDQLSDLTQKSESEKQILEERNIEIINLKQRVNEVIKENNDMLTMFNNEVLRLKNELEKEKEKYDLLNKTLSEEKHAKDKLVKEKNDLSEEIESIKQNLEDVNVANDHLQKEINLVSIEKKSLFTSLQETKAAHEEILAEKDTLTNLMAKLEEQIEKQLQDISDLKQRMNEEIKERNDMATKYNNEMCRLNNELEKENEKYDTLNKTLNEEKHAKDELLKEKNNLSEKIESIKQNLYEAKVANDHLQKEINLVSIEKQSLFTSLQETKAAYEKIMTEKETFLDSIVELKELNEKQSVENSDLKQKIQEEIKEKNDMSIKLHNEVLRLTKELEKENKKYITLNKTLSEEKHAKDELLKEKDTMSMEMVSTKQDLEAAKVASDHLQNEINLISIEKESLLNSLQETKAAYEEILMEKVALSISIAKIKEQNEHQIQEIVKEKGDLSDKMESVKQDLEEARVTNEHLRHEINLMSTEKQSLFTSLQETKATHDDVLKEKESLSNSIAKLKEQNEQQLVEIVKEKDGLYLEIESMKQNLEEAKVTSDHLRNEINLNTIEKESLLNSLQETKAAYEEILTEKETILNINAKIEEQNVKQSLEISDLKLKINEEIKEKNDLSTKYNNDVLRLNNELSEEKLAKDELVKEKDILSSEIKAVKQDLEESKMANDHLRKETNLINIEKEALLNSLQETKAVYEEIQTEKEQKLEEIIKEKDNLSVTIEIVKQDLEEAKAATDHLRNEINLINIEKESLLNSLQETKAAHEEILTEKEILENSVVKIKEQNEKQLVQLKEKLDKINTEFANVKTEKDRYEEMHDQMSTILLNGVDKLLNNLRKENVTNETLKKLISVESAALSMNERCNLAINLAETLTTELALRKNLEMALEHENTALSEMRQMLGQKDIKVLELQTEVNRLQQVINDNKIEMSKQKELYVTSIDTRNRDIQTLEKENESLSNELNDVKTQLEIKVHSLKEKLIDNEHLTDKLKKTYECQIENLNVMVAKLTNYLKDKTIELEALRKDKEKLQEAVNDNSKVVKSLEEEVKVQKHNQEKLLGEFESERLVLKNMVTVTESVMEDQKLSLSNVIAEHVKVNDTLKEENKALKEELESKIKNTEVKLQEKETLFENALKELTVMKIAKESNKKEFEHAKDQLVNEITALKKELTLKVSQVEILELKNKEMTQVVEQCKSEIDNMKKDNDELKIKMDLQQTEMTNKVDKLTKTNDEQTELNKKLEQEVEEERQKNIAAEERVKELSDQLNELTVTNDNLRREKMYYLNKAEELKTEFDTVADSLNEEIKKLRVENTNLKKTVEENQIVITRLEQSVQLEKEQNNELRLGNDNERLNLDNKCSLLQEYQLKAERQMEDQQKDIDLLHKEINTLKTIAELQENDLKEKCDIIQEKDEQINNINKDLVEMKAAKEKNQAELESKITEVNYLKQKMTNDDVQRALRSEEWVKAIGQKDTFAVAVSEKTGSHKNSCNIEKDYREFHHQVDNTTSDLTHSSMESIKTISDLERIIHDKNRTITALQSDITYLKSLIADSENKLLDVTKELEVSKENCQQLSGQLKKIVHQKNEEIAELKKQLNKMSVTENRASQIIKVSAKYQAIILKRIAEIKSNTVLKELTNFGNSANGDNELRRSLNAGTVTMEDLENFLETTDKHLKRCSEKQIALQKERDRLTEVNRINESEIINLKKFLTELSVSFKTFSTVKELYAQKFSRVVSVQRTARREVLSLEGQINDATMCKLERAYAAAMQDLAECAMNMERWVERCIGRTISPEKIKQAFTNDEDRASFASTTFQNAGLEVQLEELESSFQKLLEEVVRAQKGEGSRDAQAATVLAVRAEYEDKLNRMKAKMKQLYQEQIAVYKEKQREEVMMLERELVKTREKLAESSKAYEEHIRALTTELWSVGEKFLTKKDEADWLRKKQRSGSLMSLQHVHSSGLVPAPPEPSRPSDTHSLRSLPVHNNTNTNKRDKEGRGLHMSDEEGEVFDNRWLKELASTPRASPPRDPRRLSELRWRNSLCPPHLKSSYPAETQFQPVADEEDIKVSDCGLSLLGSKTPAACPSCAGATHFARRISRAPTPPRPSSSPWLTRRTSSSAWAT
ncbi:centromere-associated protein E-like isoform X3 [Ostrinia furnacalis]|uniref:centromere-associated protein E-like isoform X3 n=1 Tax=Ostrinia furnacalis TaxID=93504 RepID=UPI00103BB90F|nr:centromere-associated protein E-like isoform X3 [Ostrinia furnacalis]